MKKSIGKYIMLGLPAVVILVLLAAQLLYPQHWIDADMAAEMVFSRLLNETGHYIASPDWYYSTEFRIAYTQLIMVPLFSVMHSWAGIRLITNLVFYIFLLGAYFFMMKPLGFRKETVAMSSVFLLLPFSETIAQHFQLGNTYMPHVILMFLVLGLWLRLAGKPRSPMAWVCFLLLGFLCGASGVRYFLSVYAPILVAAVAVLWKGEAVQALLKEGEEQKPSGVREGCGRLMQILKLPRAYSLWVGLCGTVAALIGYVVNITLIRSTYLFTTYENTNFIRINNGLFYERAANALGCLLELFGYIPDKSVLSLRGFVTILAFVLIFCMFGGALRCGKLQKAERGKIGSDGTGDINEGVTFSLLLAFFWSSFGITAFTLLFTNTTLTPRYFLMCCVLFAPILAYLWERESLWAAKALFFLLLVLCLGVSTLKILYSLKGTDKNQERREVAAFLEEQGYTFGYALYDDANLLQELSDGAVEAGAITDVETGEFFRWSSAARYYEPEYGKGKVFLMLPVEETRQGSEDGNKLITAGREIYHSDAYVVYSYEDGSIFF